jgi:hypothetical protein
MVVEIARRAHLIDVAALHDGDAVGEAERLDLVVGDEEDGQQDRRPDRIPHAGRPQHLQRGAGRDDREVPREAAGLALL